MNPSDAAAVLILHFFPETPTISALASTLQLSHSATVRMTDRLAARGLIHKRRSGDPRSAALSLTASGRRMKDKLIRQRQEFIRSSTVKLSDDDLTRLEQILEKILFGMARTGQEADYLCRFCDESVCPQDRCPVERGCNREN
jgi:DNA-binding MarR family transcriptional regulator